MQECISQTNVSGTTASIDKLSQNKSQGFIENKGQIHDQFYQPNNSVKYILNTNGLNVQLKANSFSYDTYIAVEHPNTKKPVTRKQKHKSILRNSFDTIIEKGLSFKFHRIDVTLEGANKTPVIIPENPSTEIINYYTSASHAHGALNVHHFSKITYREIYPAIDMVFDVNQQTPGKKVEYYFIVRPGADPSNIKIHYEGAMQTQLKNNTIVITVNHGKIQEHIPASYLTADSSFDIKKLKNKINVGYKSYGNNMYGFTIPSYNPAQILIIDPIPDLEWGTYYGQTYNDWGYAIAKDNNGNIFVAGATNNESGIATAGSYQSTIGGGFEDAVLGKFNNNGVLQWLTYFGGNGPDEAYGIGCDGNNIIITGWTFSSDAIATPGSHQENKAGPFDSPDVFVAKFDNNGNRQWSTYFGGNDVDFAAAAAVDANGNIFITGFTVSPTGIATPGSHQYQYSGGNPAFGESGDGYIAKFNATGTLQWGTYYGGGRGDRCHGIAVDAIGNVLVAGSGNSGDHIASLNAYQTALSGPSDGFIVKLNNDGVRLWGTYYGGTNGDEAFAITSDHNNNIFITGWTHSNNGIATPETQQPVFGGNYVDVYVARFNPNGTRQWGTYYGGNGIEIGNAITTDHQGNIFITGRSYSTNNIVTPNAWQTTGGGIELQWTPYVAKYNPNGILKWGTYYGKHTTGDPNHPFSNGEGEGIVTDENENVFICGSTSFRSGISTCGAQQISNGGYRDIFIAKFNQNNFSSEPSILVTADTTGSFCEGLTVTFKATTVNAGSNIVYQWKINDLNVGTNSNVFVTNSLGNGDIVKCVMTILQNPCNPPGTITSNEIVVTVSSLTSPSVSITSSASNICTGNSVVFTATALNGGNNPVYQWKINDRNTGSNSKTFTTSSLATGDIVTCMMTSSSNCTLTPTAVSNPIPITVKELIIPIVTLQVSIDNVCPGTSVTINAITGDITGIPQYQWKLNGSNVGVNSMTYSSDNFSNDDSIHFIVTTTVPGCADPVSFSSDTISIKIKNRPDIILKPQDTTISIGGSVQLDAFVTGNIDHFTWSPQTGLSNPVILNPLASPSTTITYNLLVVDQNGCDANEKITIRVANDILIPNAFTPNNDGKNDLFRIPPGSAFTLSQFSIYDRWGNEIFNTKNMNKGWDGTCKGSLSPVGSYVYIIKGRSAKGEVLLKGTVILVR